MATIWEILTAVAPLLAPLLSLALVVLGRIIWNHETRIRELEKSATRHGRTIYGDDEDIQQSGLSQNLHDVVERLDRVERKIDKMNERCHGEDSWSDEFDE